jgi:hypothetical protein
MAVPELVVRERRYQSDGEKATVLMDTFSPTPPTPETPSDATKLSGRAVPIT